MVAGYHILGDEIPDHSKQNAEATSLLMEKQVKIDYIRAHFPLYRMISLEEHKAEKIDEMFAVLSAKVNDKVEQRKYQIQNKKIIRIKNK